MREYDVIETDVLVIGGGLAGASAAIEAAKQGCQIILVDKGFFGKTGIGAGNSFGYTTALIREPDTPEKLIQDMLDVGRHINKRKLVELFAEGIASGTILKLEELGVIFERDEQGIIPLRKHGAHSYARTTRFTWQNAPGIMRIGLVPEVLNLGVRVMNKTLVTRLLLKDGEIVGAHALDMINGAGTVIRAKSIVLASGNAASLFGQRPGMMTTGDGYSLALHAGASLTGMEFVSCSLGLVNTRLFPGLLGEPPTLQSSTGELPKMYNARNERFMERYDPERLEGGPKYKYMFAICNEIREGRGTPNGGIWMDITGLDENAPNREFLTHQLGPIGIDVTRTKRIEYTIAPFYFIGGVEYDTQCESDLPGLFVAGEVSGGLHGAERMPATSVPECIVFGQRAGKHAAKRAGKLSRTPGIAHEQVNDEQARLDGMLGTKGSCTPGEYKNRIQNIMGNRVGLIRDGSKLDKAEDELASLRKDIGTISVRSNSRRHNSDWIEAIENHFLIDAADLVVKASLTRKETRGAHCRDDFPKEEDSWRKRISIRQKGGLLSMSTSKGI